MYFRRLSGICLVGARARDAQGGGTEDDPWITSVVTSGFQVRQLALNSQATFFFFAGGGITKVTLLFGLGCGIFTLISAVHTNQRFHPNIHHIQACNLVTNNK